MEFIEIAGFSDVAYCNERILMQVILDYFMDVMRLKEFHSIERIRHRNCLHIQSHGSLRENQSSFGNTLIRKGIFL